MVFEVDPGTVGTTFKDTKITSSTADTTAGVITAAAASQDIGVSVLDAGPMDLQIGANEGQIMSVRIPKVTPKTLGVDKINVGTSDGAQEAIGLLDIAINQVSAIRSKLGAYQNRLEHSISNLDVTSENMTESLSRIEDADMAEEMAEYTQKNVLAQAGTSMLAQANQRPQSILSLLQN
jgi:flagellin